MENSAEKHGETDTYTLEEWDKMVKKEILYVSKANENEELNCCNYDKGYVTEEVYRCVTCYKDKSELAGICSGCAFKCHADHEVENMYFKRNFRCDCGNSKFSNIKQLIKYHLNFSHSMFITS